MSASDDNTRRLAALDHAHVWHPFTPMKQWRETEPVIIDRGEGEFLFDTRGNRYIDGVSSLWCNVHGHRVPEIDAAIRAQLGNIAHSTLLGLASPPSIELAARLVVIAPGAKATEDKLPLPPGEGWGEGRTTLCDWFTTFVFFSLPERGGVCRRRGGRMAIASISVLRALTPALSRRERGPDAGRLNKVFYSDAGATALEVAFKMAVGYWFHRGQPQRSKFIGFTGAYHGDTTGSMSVGYSEVFHKPYVSMVFPTYFAPVPDPVRLLRNGGKLPAPLAGISSNPDRVHAAWPSEQPVLGDFLRQASLGELEALLSQHADEIAGIVIEPVMQGAAGMICQPPGFLRGVAELAKKYNTLLIADEVATGFGRTGCMFACQHENIQPDILCLGKGLTGGYLPLAATLCTDAIEQAFTGELSDRKTLYHGHTFCGNALGCAAALASLDLFEKNKLLEHIRRSAVLISKRLDALRDHRAFPTVIDVRQRGLMIGIELDPQSPRIPMRGLSPRSDQAASNQAPAGSSGTAEPADDYGSPLGAALCHAMRRQGLIIRPLGNVLVLMPVPAMPPASLNRMLDIVIDTLRHWAW